MKREHCIIVCIVAMLLGIYIYIFLSDTPDIFSEFQSYIKFTKYKISNPIIDTFIQCYSADLLWSISFTFIVQAIVMLPKEKIYLLLLTPTLGVAVEISQLFHIIRGVYDICDIGVYIIGSIISTLIIYLGGKRNELQSK